MQRATHACLPLAMVVAFAGIALGQSNISPAKKYAWGENVGWTNWRDANGGADGVVVEPDFLSGYIWGENVGWIHVGDGNAPYANTDDSNYGVNILPGGDLQGYGWGENIGWVNFGTSSVAPDQARFDFGPYRFRGYAWGENVGWINLDDSTQFVAAMPPPVPAVGNWPMVALAAAWLTAGMLVVRRRRLAAALPR